MDVLSVVRVVCRQVEVFATSWSLVQRSPTDCGASLYVIKKPQEWGGHCPRWVAAPQGEGGGAVVDLNPFPMLLAKLRLCLQLSSYCNESSSKENKIIIIVVGGGGGGGVAIFPELAIHVFSGVTCYKRSSNSNIITNIYNYDGNTAV